MPHRPPHSSIPITILGAGAWGTARAISLARRQPVMLWGRNAAAMQAMAAERENSRALPGITLPAELLLQADLSAAIAHVGADGLLICATSVAGLRPLANSLRAHTMPNLVWLCKGFEEQTRRLPHQIVVDELGSDLPIGALSGPSFAQEVARGLPCALTIASTAAALRERAVAALHSPTLRVYSSEDLIGVEVGGAVKNILAIATGIIDGLDLGMNARAALITRGLTEITRLGLALGAHPETFTGLTGLGDLLLTCTGELSRNRRVGLGLAQGQSLEHLVAQLGHVAEGVRCAQAVRALAADLQVDMPISAAVAGVLFDGDAPRAMVTRLLARDPRSEADDS